LGLLPDSKWSNDLELLFAAAPHGASNGLWIGPASDQAVAAGLFATPASVKALLSTYRSHVISFTYPRNNSSPDDFLHFLMVRFDPSVLATDACR
jgi:hypothetical protein